MISPRRMCHWLLYTLGRRLCNVIKRSLKINFTQSNRHGKWPRMPNASSSLRSEMSLIGLDMHQTPFVHTDTHAASKILPPNPQTSSRHPSIRTFHSGKSPSPSAIPISRSLFPPSSGCKLWCLRYLSASSLRKPHHLAPHTSCLLVCPAHLARVVSAACA